MKLKKIFIVVVNLMIFPIIVFASEHSGGGHETAQLIGKILNSTILWGGLGYLLYKPISMFFKEKAENDKTEFETIEKAKFEKEEELKALEKRIDGIEIELSKIRKRFKDEAEKDSKAFEKKTEEDLKKIEKFTEQEIAQIYSDALKELKFYALDISINLAKERLKKKINKNKQTQLVENFINELGEMN